MATRESEQITKFLETLADQVLNGQLSRKEALERTSSVIEGMRIDDCANDQFDQCILQFDQRILDLPGSQLLRATVLAMLNCQVAHELSSDPVWGKSNRTLADLYMRQDELVMALYHYQQALEVYAPAEEVAVQTYLDIGRIYERQGYAVEARAVYEAARADAREHKYPHLESDAWNELGDLFLAEGRADEAIGAFERALNLSQGADDWRGQETALGNLGLAAHYLGRLNEAVDFYRRALALSQKHSHRAGSMRHLTHLGSALLEQGKLEESMSRFQEALKIAVEESDRRAEQQLLGSQGSLLQARARRKPDGPVRTKLLEDSLDHHRRALKIAQDRNDRRGQAEHLTNQGNALAGLGRRSEAEQAYAGALKLAEELGAVDVEWRIHYAWGKLHSAWNQEQQALERYTRTIALVERQRGELALASRSKFWQEKAALYKGAALESLRLSEREPGRLWAALEYTERARARYLADLLRGNAGPATDAGAAVQAVLKALPPLTAVIIFNVTEEGTIALIATRQSGGVAAEPGEGWRATSDRHLRARLIKQCNQADLQKLLVQLDESGQTTGGYLVDYYSNNERWRNTTQKKTCAEIYERLLSPVDDELVRMSIDRVVLMPNLGLSLLPLHACRREVERKASCRCELEREGDGLPKVKPGGDYLLDRYEISYAPSFDALHYSLQFASSRAGTDRRLLAVANPERFVDHDRDLPWADMEVEKIVGRFLAANEQDRSDDYCVLDSSDVHPANVAAVVKAAPDYEYLHFACHGHFALRDPLKSALGLTDGPLTLQAILDTLDLARTRLVVMSACETGMVDPGDLADEFFSLPAGFLRAKVPAVLSSLWTVNDFSTALFMERFYQCLLINDPDRPHEGPLPPAQALRRAQIWMRDSCSLSQEEVEAYMNRLSRQVSKPELRFYRSELSKYVSSGDHRPFSLPFHWAAFTITAV